jgi:hypothetical protein
MRRTFIFAGALFALNFSANTQAFEIGAGISFSNKYLTVSTLDDKKIADFEGDSGLWPYLSIKTDDKYFGDSSLGYFYYGWYSQSAVDKVKDNRSVTLPSPVHLQFLYAGATAFYVFGDRKVIRNNGHSQHAVGIGAGWGASRIKGKIPASYTTTGVTEEIDSSLTGSSVNIFYRYMWDVSAVQVKNGARKYDTSDTTFTIGKYFEY